MNAINHIGTSVLHTHATLHRLMFVKASYSAVIKVDITSLCLWVVLTFARLRNGLSLIRPIIGLPSLNAMWIFNDCKGH